jgi:nucleoside-diphosphate-sugar epimerase
MTRRVLVTGATGFVGQVVCRHLLSSGAHVSAVTRNHASIAGLEALGVHQVHVHDGTMTGMLALMRDARPHATCHLAAEVRGCETPGDIDALITGNLLFGAQLLESLTQYGEGRVLTAGTYWEHYAGDGAVCLYAASKQAYGSLLRYYCEARGLRAISLVLYDTYGPDDRRGKFLQILRDAALTQAPVDATDGHQSLDLVHVDDVAAGFMVALDRLFDATPASQERFAIRTGQTLTLRELADLVGRSMGCAVPVRWGARPMPPRTIMSPPELPVLPGWRPARAVGEALPDLLCGQSAGASPPP